MVEKIQAALTVKTMAVIALELRHRLFIVRWNEIKRGCLYKIESVSCNTEGRKKKKRTQSYWQSWNWTLYRQPIDQQWDLNWLFTFFTHVSSFDFNTFYCAVSPFHWLTEVNDIKAQKYKTKWSRRFGSICLIAMSSPILKNSDFLSFLSKSCWQSGNWALYRRPLNKQQF